MKVTAKTIILYLALVCLSGLSLYLYFDGEANEKRLTYDLKASLQTAVDYKTKDGYNASKLIAQELTIQELRRINPQIIESLKNLYIAPRLAQSYTQTKQTFQATIKATVIDSIVHGTGVNRFTKEFIKADSVFSTTIKILKYQDKWISINGKVYPDTAEIKILATDSIFTAIYKGVRRHPWAWILSKRQLTTAATNRSPYILINVIQAGIINK